MAHSWQPPLKRSEMEFNLLLGGIGRQRSDTVPVPRPNPHQWSMGDEDAVWNAYIDTHDGREPSKCEHLSHFSKTQTQFPGLKPLNFTSANAICKRNKGKGKIPINNPESKEPENPMNRRSSAAVAPSNISKYKNIRSKPADDLDTLRKTIASMTSNNAALERKIKMLEATNSRQRTEIASLKQQIATNQRQQDEESRIVIESLNDEMERLRRESAVQNERRKESRKKVMTLQKQNAELIEIQSSLEQRLSEYENERRESQMKISKLESKVKELESKVLNEQEFMEWDWEQIVIWILSLEKGSFREYEEVLKQTLSEDGTTGEDLLEIGAYGIKFWGIKDKKHRAALNDHIQRLKQQYGPQQNVIPMAAAATPKEDEGAPPTPFIDK